MTTQDVAQRDKDRKAKSVKGKGKQTGGMEENGLLLRWLEIATLTFLRISLGRFLERRQANWLDLYFSGWFIIQAAVLITLAFIRLDNPAAIVLIGLFSYRLLEIAVTMFDSVFIAVMQKKRHRSVPRLFSLVFVSYIEVVMIFGVIFNFLMDHPSVLDSLFLSVSEATLAGSSFENPSNAMFAAGIAEMLLGIFFVTGVIATIASFLGSKE